MLVAEAGCRGDGCQSCSRCDLISVGGLAAPPPCRLWRLSWLITSGSLAADWAAGTVSKRGNQAWVERVQPSGQLTGVLADGAEPREAGGGATAGRGLPSAEAGLMNTGSSGGVAPPPNPTPPLTSQAPPELCSDWTTVLVQPEH